MPDKSVKTIKDQIFFQYAKIITKSSFWYKDCSEAKRKAYWFIKQKFNELKSWKICWSNITKEDWEFVGSEKECIYCGSKEDLQKEHIVPKSLKIKEECKTCQNIQSISNQLWACKVCNQKKSDMWLYKFYSKILDDEKFYDKLPSLLEKKYLKTIYNCHNCAWSLDIEKDDISVVDLDL